MHSILTELNSVFEALPENAVESAARAIETHARIFVYAAGRSGLMLRALAMRLAQMGRTVYVVGETVTPAIEEGDLLIVASASGSTHSTRHYAKCAKEAGARVFVITANTESPLTEITDADIVLHTSSKDSAAGSQQIMGSLFEQALLLFCDAVVQGLPCDASAMRKRHANLE